MTSYVYPLEWPDGWERTPEVERRRGWAFKTTFDKARRELIAEADRLGATGLVVSSWLPVRKDGEPYSDSARRRIPEPGVAIYFMRSGRRIVMARDAYDTIHDNLRSIGLALEFLRGLERHGGASMMERAFEGFMALPPPGELQRRPWREVLSISLAEGQSPETGLIIVEAVYRARCKDAGEGHASLVELNLAIEDARKELRP